MSVYDKDGRKAAKKADGSFALPNGNYCYVRVHIIVKMLPELFPLAGRKYNC